MGIYLGSNELGGGGGSGGSGATLTGTTTYRALLVGGGGNGFFGSSYGAGGSGGGAVFETILPFFSDITYNVVVGAGGGESSFETAIGKYKAPTGGQGKRHSPGLAGACGGGGNSANSTFQAGGPPAIYDFKGNYLYPLNGSYEYGSSLHLRGLDYINIAGAQTFGFAGGYANSTNECGGGGGAGGPGVSNTASGAGGIGKTVDIITAATATSASVGHVDSGNVYFARGGYGSRSSTVNTTGLGGGPNAGGGGQGSNTASGVSSGDSGCVILKVPTDTDFTQTGASTYTDQGMTAIIWTGTGTFQINS